MEEYVKSIQQRNFFSGNNYIIFTVCAFLYIAISYISNEYIYTEEVYFNMIGDQYTNSRMQELLSVQKYLQRISYLLFPVILCIKVALPALCIYVYLLFEEKKTSWKEVFRIALISELVFIAGAFVRCIYFLLSPPQSMDEMSGFSSLSLSIFFPAAPSYFSYALQSINLFEIIYWIVLALGIKSLLKTSFKNSIGIVAKSYGPGLLLWLVLICFLLVQVS